MPRILHTADWHLGRQLQNHSRAEEHTLFLDWLLGQVRETKPDLLLVAGDIFDMANPPQWALAQYYEFLAKVVSQTGCHTLVLAGNHDSPLTLDAPKELLKSLRVTVVGAAAAAPEDAVLDLGEFLVCAAPFLRERDIRKSAPGQSASEIAEQLRQGIRQYYARLHEYAAQQAKGRPIIATGHLTAVGVTVSPSEREIHVGNLGAIAADCFEGFAYTALGHIHRAQIVGENPRVRYSGSPIPLSFAELGCDKEILLIDLPPGGQPEVNAIQVPCFRRLAQVRCDYAFLRRELLPFSAGTGLAPYLDILVENAPSRSDLLNETGEIARELGVVIVKTDCTDRNATTTSEASPWSGKSLHEFSPTDVFLERLRRESLDPESEEGAALLLTFQELLSKMTEENALVPADA